MRRLTKKSYWQCRQEDSTEPWLKIGNLLVVTTEQANFSLAGSLTHDALTCLRDDYCHLRDRSFFMGRGGAAVSGGSSENFRA